MFMVQPGKELPISRWPGYRRCHDTSNRPPIRLCVAQHTLEHRCMSLRAAHHTTFTHEVLTHLKLGFNQAYNLTVG
jgi:hypothetical protein